jgi:tRNA (guanine-N7-)-methyltransferase
MQAHFLTSLANKALSGIHLCFRTDFEPYFRDVEETIRAHPDWALVDAVWPFELPTVFQQRAAIFHSLVAQRR